MTAANKHKNQASEFPLVTTFSGLFYPGRKNCDINDDTYLSHPPCARLPSSKYSFPVNLEVATTACGDDVQGSIARWSDRARLSSLQGGLYA